MIQLECYHGTSLEIANKIVQENRFLPSPSKELLRMGEGAYFFKKASGCGFAEKCARAFCISKYGNADSNTHDYAVLKCNVSCEEDQYLNLFDEQALEAFHIMRYLLYDRISFPLQDAAQLDTMVINLIKKDRDIAVVCAPHYFAPLACENRIIIKSKRSYRKTYLPNVLMVCADPEKAIISDISIVERGRI